MVEVVNLFVILKIIQTPFFFFECGLSKFFHSNAFATMETNVGNLISNYCYVTLALPDLLEQRASVAGGRTKLLKDHVRLRCPETKRQLCKEPSKLLLS